MAKYIKFKTLDWKQEDFEIIVRIDANIDSSVVNEIKKEFYDMLDDESRKEDTDEMMIEDVLSRISKKYDFGYEFIGTDYKIIY